MSNILDQIAANTPDEIKYYVDVSFDIADRIYAAMEKKGLSQKEFAKLLNKQESEISKWLAGTHNFTLKTLSKITIALGEEIIQVPHSMSDTKLLENSLHYKIDSKNEVSAIFESTLVMRHSTDIISTKSAEASTGVRHPLIAA